MHHNEILNQFFDLQIKPNDMQIHAIAKSVLTQYDLAKLLSVLSLSLTDFAYLAPGTLIYM